MATSMPARATSIIQRRPEGDRLTQTLLPWQRRITLRQLCTWTLRGMVGGFAIACFLLIIARYIPWASVLFWASGSAIACAILACGAAIWSRPSLPATARHVDHYFSLHDRVGTAWEMRDKQSALANLQRRDALTWLQKYKPGTTISLWPGRLTLLSLLFLGLLLLALINLPNPMTAILKQQAELQAQLNKQISSIEHIRTGIAQQHNLSQTEKQQVNQILQNLETQLQNAKSQTQAQQDIANAQAKLDQLHNPQAGNLTQAQTAAGQSLAGSNNANLKAAGQALQNNDSKALSNALKQLEQQAGSLSADQRNQLAQDLSKAANQGSQNGNLSTSLNQLARGLADGNANDIQNAANAVSSAAAQTNADQTNENAVNNASQGLQNAANSLASATDTTNNGQPGSSTGQNQQGQSQQGQGRQGQGQQGQGRQGQGQQGQGQQGQGQQGQGQQGQGQQGQGQQGKGQGQNGSGSSQNNANTASQSGKNEQVYVQGQSGQGASAQDGSNTNGIAQNGSNVPYSQVIQQYAQEAHDAIDNSNISPDLKDMVENYFNTLEGQHS